MSDALRFFHDPSLSGDAPGIYQGEDLLAGDDQLPIDFVHRDLDGNLWSYWDSYPNGYDVHRYDAAHDAWLPRGSIQIEDDLTVLQFLATRAG